MALRPWIVPGVPFSRRFCFSLYKDGKGENSYTLPAILRQPDGKAESSRDPYHGKVGTEQVSHMVVVTDPKRCQPILEPGGWGM